MTYYHHQQFGKTLVAIFGGGAILTFLIMILASSRASVTLLLASALFLVGAILFSSLTISIDDTHLRWAFGPGLIRNQIALETIRDISVTTTSRREGWGIRSTARGRLYSVSGRRAVTIRLKEGKPILLGSDEPDKLATILQERIRKEKACFPDARDKEPRD